MSDKEEGRLRRSRRAAAVAGPLIPYNIADFLDSDEDIETPPPPKFKKSRTEVTIIVYLFIFDQNLFATMLIFLLVSFADAKQV
jgi:hypothetical protein